MNSVEWEEIAHCVDVLSIFNEVTKEISAEQNVSLSKTCVLYRIMLKKIGTYSDNVLPSNVILLKKELMDGLQKRFGENEGTELTSQAMLLDPRFKKQAFGDDGRFQMAYQSVVRKLRQA